MSGKPIDVVGAGLAGLVAAINLAREGFEVTVHERGKQLGGRPSVRPDPAGSPFQLERLTNFIGVDISGACQLNRQFSLVLWGKKRSLAYRPGMETYMVERGARPSSLDTLLLREAERVGVRVRYGSSFDSRRQFSELPPNSIITVGLEEDGYGNLGLPIVPLSGYYARGKTQRQEPEVCLYFDDYTRDYGFTSNINGCSFAFLIVTRGRMAADAPERFRRQAEATSGYRFSAWQTFEDAVLPHASARAPRLYFQDKILAGSACGMMDPILYFGMLGAMVSGKIAANAVTRPRLAQQQFRQALSGYPRAWRTKRLLDGLPSATRRRALCTALTALGHAPAALQRHVWASFVPGYGTFG